MGNPFDYNQKTLLQSDTIRGVAVTALGFLVQALVSFGVITPDTIQTQDIINIVTLFAQLVGTIWAIVGRIKANSKIV